MTKLSEVTGSGNFSDIRNSHSNSTFKFETESHHLVCYDWVFSSQNYQELRVDLASEKANEIKTFAVMTLSTKRYFP